MMRRRLALVTLLSALTVVLLAAPLVTLFVVLPAIQQAREAARREQVKNNLKAVALALHQYHERHSDEPPALSIEPDPQASDR